LGDRRVTLTDTGCLDDDEVEAGRLAGRGDVVKGGRDDRAGGAGREAAEVHLALGDGVHAYAVAEERSPSPSARGVDGDDGDAQLVLAVASQTPDQLVGEGRLARSACPGDAENRDGAAGGGLPDLLEPGRRDGTGLEASDEAGQGPLLTREDRLDVGRLGGEVDVALGDEPVDHARQAQTLTVLRAEDVDATLTQQLDLGGDDDSPATAVHLDVPRSPLTQALHEVAEVLDVTALVGRDRHALGILLDGGRDDLVDAAVVPEV